MKLMSISSTPIYFSRYFVKYGVIKEFFRVSLKEAKKHKEKAPEELSNNADKISADIDTWQKEREYADGMRKKYDSL